MNLLLRPWRRIVDFKGRATRREFWLLELQLLVLLFAYAMLMGAAVRAANVPAVAGTLSLGWLGLLAAGMLVHISAAVRRLHDHDKTGWFILLSGVPLVGWIFYLIMMLTPGTAGENSYGYDPRDGDLPSVEEVAAVFR